MFYDRSKLSRLKKVFEISENDIVLDAGCGYGLRSIEMSSKSTFVLSIDLSIQCLKYLKNTARSKKIFPIAADIQYLPFRNEIFDRIISIHVLEHVKNDRQAIFEFRRVLKPTGITCVAVPEFVSEGIFLKIEPHTYRYVEHIRRYRPKELLNLCRNCGLTPYIWFKWEFFRFIYGMLRGLLRIPLEKQTGRSLDTEQHTFFFRLATIGSEILLNSKIGIMLDNFLSRLISRSFFCFLQKELGYHVGS